jgi:hypothetical protein
MPVPEHIRDFVLSYTGSTPIRPARRARRSPVSSPTYQSPR